MIDMKLVGNKIAELRKSKQLTKQELAEKIGVSHQAVSKWENAIALPDIELLTKLSELFDITVDSLIKGEDISQSDIEFEIGLGVINYVKPSVEGNLMQQIPLLRDQINKEMGYLVPKIHIRDNVDMNPLQYAISYKGEVLLDNDLENVDEEKRVGEMLSFIKFIIKNHVVDK